MSALSKPRVVSAAVRVIAAQCRPTHAISSGAIVGRRACVSIVADIRVRTKDTPHARVACVIRTHLPVVASKLGHAGDAVTTEAGIV